MEKDLVVLVADKNIEFTIRGILTRYKALGMRSISEDIFVHPERDSGCFARGEEFLRPFSKRYAHALVMLDRDGSGRDSTGREVLEGDLERRLAQSGWEGRAVAVIIQPELEAWIWGDSPHIDDVLGWRGRSPGLRTWLASAGFVKSSGVKPDDPKKALGAALRLASKPRSSALFSHLAQKVSLTRCTDPAFLKLRSTLHGMVSVLRHAGRTDL